MASEPGERTVRRHDGEWRGGWISPRAIVAPGVTVGHGAYIGPDAVIGRHTTIHANAVILGPASIGSRVVVGPGTVVGCEGFGYELTGGRYVRLPHTGRVVVEDEVELGANCTVCRAKEGRETRIGQGTKIDCLVHIGHNVRIGRHCVIAAQSGIAGSATIGDRVMLAGQVGIKDHVTVGDDCVLYAKSALFRSIPAGSRYSGIPARPHGQVKRFWARLWRTFPG